MSTLPDIAVSVGDIGCSAPFMNGAGVVKTLDDVEQAASMPMGAVVQGSNTLHQRSGFPGPPFYMEPNGVLSLNALGLPNPGAGILKRDGPEMARVCHDQGKPLIISGAGFSPEDYAELYRVAADIGAGAFEANFSCPNDNAPLIAFDPASVDKTLRDITRAARRFRSPIPVWAKLPALLTGARLRDLRERVQRRTDLRLEMEPPTVEPAYRKLLTELLLSFRIVRAITIPNTVAGCRAFARDEETGGEYSVIDPAVNDGYAGMGGPVLRALALEETYLFSRAMAKTGHRIDIVCAAGMHTGGDVGACRAVGGTAIQFATPLYRSGNSPLVASRIAREYVEELEAE